MATDGPVRQHTICTDCGLPATDALTTRGRVVWLHEQVLIGPGDEHVPGTWTSNGTHWVPDHMATPSPEVETESVAAAQY
jgi:hypothetical protein